MTRGNAILAHAALVALLLAALASASSHSEAPGTASIPNADVTDLYAFNSYETGREGFVTFVVNVHPLIAPFGGPNYASFGDKHVIDLLIDNDGDAVEDVVFRFRAGASLGGDNATVKQVDPQDHLGDACPPTTLVTEDIFMRQGIELDIGGQSVAVPLKFIGPLSRATEATNLNWLEHVDVTRYDGPADASSPQAVTKAGSSSNRFRVPFPYAGTKTFGSADEYEAYARTFLSDIDIPNCQGSTRQGRIFMGQRKESFSVNLGGIFDLINFVPVVGLDGAIENDERNDPLNAFNVNAFVIEVPKECVLASAGSDTFGVWTTTREILHYANGTHFAGRQVARLGNPLVNEVVIGLRDKALFNADVPSNDGANGFGPYVTNPTLPAIIDILFKDDVNAALGTALTNLAPDLPRNDLVAAFLTGLDGINKISPTAAVGEYLRLNTSIPPVAPADQNNMGVIAGDNAGFPNGRRPGDDVTDIALTVMMGRLCMLNLGFCAPENAPVGAYDITDGAPQNAAQFDDAFPYLKSPLPGYVAQSATPEASPATALEAALCYVF